MSELTIGSLCSGYGGLDLAVEAALNARTAWVSDIDKGACKVLAHRFPHAPNIGDMTAADWASVESVDIITAGYPCQPFSGNGARKGANDERHLWPHVLRAIRRVRPRLIVLENVEDHLTLGFGDVLADLASSGLDASWCLLSASDVGAPHGRPRLFIVATHPGGFVYDTEESRGLAGAVREASASAGPQCVDGDGACHEEDQVAVDRGGDRGPWGPFTGSVRAWERILGRPAPADLVRRSDGLDDINPAFVEWSMGLPAGWVTEVPGLTPNQMFHALGNGVVPQQAESAIRFLLPIIAGLEAAA